MTFIETALFFAYVFCVGFLCGVIVFVGFYKGGTK
jgi:hypothetical protein